MQTNRPLSEPVFSTATPMLSRGSLDIVRAILREIEGLAEVRVLPVRDRAPSNRPKLFVVLATHDVRRDSRVVERLCQLPDIDFDLVPQSARHMIPDAAERIQLD